MCALLALQDKLAVSVFVSVRATVLLCAKQGARERVCWKPRSVGACVLAACDTTGLVIRACVSYNCNYLRSAWGPLLSVGVALVCNSRDELKRAVRACCLQLLYSYRWVNERRCVCACVRAHDK